jgi:type III restriction enzyme
VKTGSGVKTTSKLVTEGYDLFQQSGKLEEYREGFVIDRIDGVNGFIHLLNDTTPYIGEMVGAINEELIRRIQIRETIRTHIERERKLFYKGIKVLSLFFIDHVENYRLYDNEGTKLGRYAEIFEEEYARVISEMMPTFEEGEYIKYLQRIDATRTHQAISRSGGSDRSKFSTHSSPRHDVAKLL